MERTKNLSSDELDDAGRALYDAGCGYKGWDNITVAAREKYCTRAHRVLCSYDETLI